MSYFSDEICMTFILFSQHFELTACVYYCINEVISSMEYSLIPGIYFALYTLIQFTFTRVLSICGLNNMITAKERHDKTKHT